MNWLMPILAQAEAGQAPPLYPQLILFGFVGLMFILFMRASSRQKREQATLLSSLKKNDEVVTTSGILGIVLSIKENADEVTLKCDDSGTRIRVLKSSIARILTPAQTETKS
jgi:preprotein translocase subunit YajC